MSVRANQTSKLTETRGKRLFSCSGISFGAHSKRSYQFFWFLNGRKVYKHKEGNRAWLAASQTESETWLDFHYFTCWSIDVEVAVQAWWVRFWIIQGLYDGLRLIAAVKVHHLMVASGNKAASLAEEEEEDDWR